ncbi:MAG: beta-N-acetylhexosaminidase, partial [Chitinophagaceae bacterium]
MKQYITIILLFVLGAARAQQGIIPQPQKLVWQKGVFVFNQCTYLQFDSSSKELQWAVAPLKEKFGKAAGLDLTKPLLCNKSTIVTITLDSSITHNEGYGLTVDPQRIIIRAKRPAGVFYAVQSLLQLLPVEIESAQHVQKVVWQVPAVSIEDAPRFSYRGLMLDVARHFMHIDSVKRFIDLLAKQKSNRFHWHLTDSQGWRFESKKWPKLNAVAAYRKGTPLNTTYDYDNRPGDTLYGGYYTQAQMREVVQYAAERFIIVVPEIEMPAHSRSALAAYPQFACLDSNGKPFPYPQAIQDEYCTKEETFSFLSGILTEVMEIFPSTYIHIAGDESAKEAWKSCPHDRQRMQEEGLKNVEELQSYFVKRIAGFVNSKGRKVIGWDEIMEGGLAQGATVMSWTGIQNGIKAAQMGHGVIMTPGSHCYFDHYQSDAHGEPIAWGGLTTLEKVYSYDPVPAELSKEEALNILGTQGNLWTEFIPTAAKTEYMVFPRAIALAELAWSSKEKKDFSDFKNRLIPYLKRLDAYGVNYARHLYRLELKDSIVGGTLVVQLSVADSNKPIYYTLDGSQPNENSAVYKSPLHITKSAAINAVIIEKGIGVAQMKRNFNLHQLTGKKAVLAAPPSRQYSKGGADAWHNGSPGSEGRFDDEEWLGWNNKPFDVTIEMGNSD